MPTETAKFHPFHCGSQDADWSDRNCARCIKSSLLIHPPPKICDCGIEQALLVACFDDGSVSKEIAQRMGYIKEDGSERFKELTWDCPERDIPEGLKVQELPNA